MGSEILLNSPTRTFNLSEFVQWTEQLVSKGIMSGAKQSEARIKFTGLNQQRMKRINKTVRIKDEFIRTLSELNAQQDWYIITEAWCGDSALNLPKSYCLIGRPIPTDVPGTILKKNSTPGMHMISQNPYKRNCCC